MDPATALSETRRFVIEVLIDRLGRRWIPDSVIRSIATEAFDLVGRKHRVEVKDATLMWSYCQQMREVAHYQPQQGLRTTNLVVRELLTEVIQRMREYDSELDAHVIHRPSTTS